MFKNIFALIGLTTVVFFGIGWYRGWYHFDVQDKTIHIDINRDKVRTDISEGVDRGGQIIDDIRKDKGGQEGKSSMPSTASTPSRANVDHSETHNFFAPSKPTPTDWKPIQEVRDNLPRFGNN